MNARTCRRWVLGFGGAAMLAGTAALAERVEPTQHETPVTELSSLVVIDNSDVKTAPAGPTRRNALRSPPPAPGGGCQQNGNFVHLLSGQTIVGFGSTITTAATGTTRIDNFKVAGAGSQNLESLSWSGWIETGATPNIVNVTPTNRRFIVTVWSSNAVSGEPVLPALSTQTITPSFAVNAADTVPSGNANPGPQTLQVYDFTATLPAPVALQGGQCYWLEIRPDNTAGGGFATTDRYFWRSSGSGDGYNLRRTPNAGGVLIDPSSRGIQLGDMAFCVNLPTVSMADGLGCVQPSQMTCRADPAAQCHAWDSSGNAFASHAAGTGFNAADNFTIGGAGPLPLTGGCFQGIYPTANNTVPATADDFTITVYADQGAANPGVPGAVIASRQVSTAAGNLVRDPANQLINVFTTFAQAGAPQGLDVRGWSFDLSADPITLPGPGCYWLEVRSNNTATPWFWLAKGNARPATIADGFRQQKAGAGAYTQATQLFNGDFTWCLRGVASRIVRSTECVAVQPIPNQTCATAATLAVGGATLFSHNLFDVPAGAVPPTCGANIANDAGAWFRFTGTGQNVTVSTCNTGADPRAAETNFDSTLFVYCSRGATACDGPFICLASNDNAAPACATNAGRSSTVTVPTVNGATYFVYVSGVTLANTATDRGYFYLNAVNAGAPATPAPACADLSICRVDVPTGAVSEDEDCGELGPNAACTTAEVLPLDIWATGTVAAGGGVRDTDLWQPPAAQNLTDGGQWFTIDFRTEVAVTLAFFRSACDPVNGLVNGVGFTVGACTNGDSFNFFVPAGDWFVLVRPNSFENPACDVTARGNRYVLRARAAVTGVCCVGGSECVVTVASSAAGAAGDPQDCVGRNGSYLGDNTTCQAQPDNANAPCDAAGGAPATAVLGTCCDPYGNCFVAVQGQCSAAFNPAVTACAADGSTCPFIAARCCFPNGTCIVVAQAQCTDGTFTATDQTCTPNDCTQPPNGACCDLNGNCFALQQRDCPVGGGVTFSAGACTPSPCPQPTACCDGTACTVVLPANCAGTSQPAGTLCAPTDPCAAPTTVVCCRGSTCDIVNTGDCTLTGVTQAGVVQGTGATCNAAGVNTAPCCKADYNKVGNVELLDIFAFLNDWFGNRPYADFNGQNNVDLLDIFAFLTAWFAGPCP